MASPNYVNLNEAMCKKIDKVAIIRDRYLPNSIKGLQGMIIIMKINLQTKILKKSGDTFVGINKQRFYL